MRNLNEAAAQSRPSGLLEQRTVVARIAATYGRVAARFVASPSDPAGDPWAAAPGLEQDLARHPRGSDPGGLQRQIITSVAELERLEAEWNGLYAAAPRAHLSDGFAWSRIAWEQVAAPRGRRLACMAVRRGAQLVAVWPLVVSRRALWRVASPLTSETSEYCPFLIHPDADPEQVWSAIRDTLVARGDVDALCLPWVRDDGPLGRLLSGTPDAVSLFSLPAPVLSRASFADWEGFRSGLSKNQRANLRRDRQRLSEHGEVRFEEVTDAVERLAVWSWMLATKRAWLDKRRLRNDWMFSESYARFVTASLDAFGASGERRIFALKVNGAVAAAELDNVDRARVESFLGVIDERFARCSPGNLLREECVRWAVERQLDYDHRLGGDPYKFAWATHVPQAIGYAVAVTRWGKLFLRYMVARGSGFGRRVGLLLYRWRRRSGGTLANFG